MNRAVAAALVVLTVSLTAVVAADADVLVRNATVWTQGPEGVLEGADVLVRGGRIEKIGRGLPAPPGLRVIDATGKHVTPGLIDCHSHVAIRGGVNEGSNNVTAEVRIADVVDPGDENIYRALAGGLTTSNLLHGSANSIGGQNAVVKMKWKSTAGGMLLPGAPEGIKLALGENPKRSNFRAPGEPRYPATRMGVMESIRERFLAARDYGNAREAWAKLPKAEQERRVPPRRDLQLEALAEILRGERLVHAHAYRQDEMLALMRLAEEFGVRIATFQHALEGYKIADELAAHGAGASSFSDWWAFKLEAYDAIPFNGALMHDRGVLVSFNSDSAELARRMNLEAAKAVKYGGLPEAAALDFVTINAARQLGIEARVGSLQPGKDADFVIWSGSPLSTYTIAEQTWIEGRVAFDRAADLEGRGRVEQDRAEAIAGIRGDRAAATPPAATPATRPAPTPVPASYADRLAATSGTVSIVNAVVHTVSGGTIDRGTVSFRGGRIVEVGAGLPPLAGAEVVDAQGRHLYPGLIDANSAVGLIEIGSVSGSVDLAETGAINPQVNAAIAVNPDSELIAVTRANGITHVHTAPVGGLVSGTSALVRLAGWTWEDLTAASPLALHVQWPSYRVRRGSGPGGAVPSEEDQRKERDESLKKISRLFSDARAYARAKGPRVPGAAPFESDAALEAMQPVLDGRLPVIVHASEIRQIRAALAWAAEEGIRMILSGDGDVARAADLLAQRNVPVVLEGVLSLPAREDEPYDAAYTAAARLHAAGVPFAISSGGGSFGSSNARNLPYHAAMAAAFGLPREEALRSVTLYPARILGVERDLGSIEPGKSASLILTDGDPLEIRTRVLSAWIDGRAADLTGNRHERLYRKYESRPRVAAEVTPP